jgi:hypothetical protein
MTRIEQLKIDEDTCDVEIAAGQSISSPKLVTFDDEISKIRMATKMDVGYFKQIEALVEKSIREYLNQRYLHLDQAIYDDIRHYILTTAKQRGWRGEQIIQAVEAILYYTNEENPESNPRGLNEFAKKMQELTLKIY